MPNSSQRFDPHLKRSKSDALKRIVPTFGGRSTMRKQECIDFLLAALDDPAVVRKAVNALEPFEQMALALVKQAGGALNRQALASGVLASGATFPPRLLKQKFSDQITTHLIRRGLVMSEGYYSSYSHSSVNLFSDPRILAHVGPLQTEPLGLDAARKPATTVIRMPPTVVLEIIGFLQALENLGGIGLTQKGDLRVNDVSKVRKAVGMPKGDWEIDGVVFRDGFDGLIGAFSHSEFLDFKEAYLLLTQPVAEIAGRAYGEQVATLLNGFLGVRKWNELDGAPSYIRYGTDYQQIRTALIFALSSLPFDEEAFYTVDAFEHALFQRIGEHFSVRGSVDRYLYTYGKTPAEVKQIEADRRLKRREKWLENERPWIVAALSSWLYYLGLVELGLDGRDITTFRLTELGKAVLHPMEDLSAAAPAEAADGSGTWVVQPNFDVVVYLDRTTPLQLAFLERHAERTHAQQYTAHYRLTRQSVYGGLESGTTLHELLDQLEEFGQTPLPQNVRVEIEEWAMLREQVVLYERAHLIEFATPNARQAALATEPNGRAVGDRFLLVLPILVGHYYPSKELGQIERIDYSKPLSKVLTIEETGQIRRTKATSDLLLTPQLEQWTTAKEDGVWQLDENKVRARVKPGLRVDELIELLTARLTHPLPPILELALRNWAGRSKTVEVEPFVLLRCGDQAVVRAILESTRLEPHLRGRLDEDVLLFDRTKIADVKEILEWAGFKVSDLSNDQLLAY